MMIAKRIIVDGNEKQAQSYSEIPWEAWCRNSANSICENCRNYCAGCRWTREFLPVDGWIARHNVVDNRANQRLESYKILFCPEFILDAETEPLGMEKQYEVIAELLELLIDKAGKFQTSLNKNYRAKVELKQRVAELEAELRGYRTENEN